MTRALERGPESDLRCTAKARRGGFLADGTHNYGVSIWHHASCVLQRHEEEDLSRRDSVLWCVCLAAPPSRYRLGLQALLDEQAGHMEVSREGLCIILAEVGKLVYHLGKGWQGESLRLVYHLGGGWQGLCIILAEVGKRGIWR
jgi:hypothetical protein